MYIKFEKFSSIIFLCKSNDKFPVFRVNFLSPLGHSGHPKLHAVVGSILRANGIPACLTRLVVLEI